MEEKNSLSPWLKHTDLWIALGLMGVLVVMVFPVPAFLLDFLLVLSISGSVVILLLSIYASRPLDFSVFPTALLIATLFRLALNVATTRLVLTKGHEGMAAAGRVIETFGHLVVGGSYVVGIVVFLLLVIINFVVITKGSGRVAEVAARFILDAMPGKQMSIDADLNAGLINEDQARERRRRIEAEADFYGAMDGASKFVRGDAIAGLLIIAVNLVGGLTIGVLQKGLDLQTAASLYTLMTIGDGLVTQIPSLIVSTAAGIIVTRSASSGYLSQEFAKQILFQPRALGFTAAILGFIGLIPGVPFFPFFLVAATLGGCSYAIRGHQQKEKEKTDTEEKEKSAMAANDTTAPPEVDALELQVGYGLVALVEGDTKGDLVDRIFSLRREFAKDLGLVVPKVRIKDNLELQAGQYSLLIKGVAVGGWELLNGYNLAMDPGGVDETLSGIETQEPVFGLSSVWIPEKMKERAKMAGYTVVDHSVIIATHLSEILRKHAYELIGRQEVQALIDGLSKTHPKVVEELKPEILPLGTIVKVCQNLLREQVPIRDFLTLMETLANHASQTKDPELLTEYVRAAMARIITHRLSRGGPELEVLTVSSRVEEVLLKAYQATENGGAFNVDQGYLHRLVSKLQEGLQDTVFASGNPVLLCMHPRIRSVLRKYLERFIPNVHVISQFDIASFAKLKSLGVVEI